MERTGLSTRVTVLRIVAETFERNLAALRRRSPRTAEAVRAVRGTGVVTVTHGTRGDVILEVAGKALDSRRDPHASADRSASTVTAERVVVVGFGAGYLTEALVRRGIRVAAVVEPSPDVLAAAMTSRDLETLLDDVPVVLLHTLVDPVELATLRAQAQTVLPHGPTVATREDAASLVCRWPDIPVATRRPRVLVVGPIVGGSLGIARATATACRTAGCETRLFDASNYADAHGALDALTVPLDVRRRFQGELATLVGQAVVATCERWRPDLVLALAQTPLDRSALDHLRTGGVTTAFWFVENCRVLTYWRHVASLYDWFYAIQPGRFLEQLEDAGAIHTSYLPVACDPAEHRPLELSTDEQARFGGDVSFAGSPYLNRQRIFSKLTDLPLRLWGPGWTDVALAPMAADGGRTFTIDEMVKIFSATRINLNLHSASHVEGCDPDPDYVNPRTFELAACGAFQLVDARAPLPELFAHDEMVTFENVHELRALITRFLREDDERVAVAGRARERALKEHTYVHRIRRVLRDTLAPELLASVESPPSRPEPLTDVLIRRKQTSPTLDPEEALMRVVRVIETTQEAR